MNSFAAIRYFNYRKNVSFRILKTFDNIKNAEEYAFNLAKDEFGEELVEGVSGQEYVEVYSVLSHEGYTKEDGYDDYVYTVIEIPEQDRYDLESGPFYEVDWAQLETEYDDDDNEWLFSIYDENGRIKK